MIESTAEELTIHGFETRPGLVADVLYTPDLYMILNSGPLTIIMKSYGKDYYIPHRATDVNNNKYHEGDFNSSLSRLSKLETIEELLSLLRSPNSQQQSLNTPVK